ncbi:MAG: cation diffusion facilitator family transporter [Evtepia sp.]
MNFLIRLFIRNPSDFQNQAVRKQYGDLASFTGAGVNFLLFALKFVLGLISGSIAILADAVNNLSDIGSNIVTFLGFRLAAQPPDKKHPFGHGRLEYISGLFIAIVVILVGVEIIKSSISKVLHPQLIEFNWWIIAGLLFSIILKLWLGHFYKNIGKRIDASSLFAAAADSESDCISTAATLIGMLIFHFAHFNLDGILGILVGVFILWNGVKIVQDMILPLLGSAPDPELVNEIKHILRSYEICVGVHDMVIHDYGPGRLMGSAHMEIPAECDILSAHDQVDNAEREISQKLNMPFVIHMDPVETKSEEVLALWTRVKGVLDQLDNQIGFHDFRVVWGETHTNLIFDVVPPYGCAHSNAEIAEALQHDFADESPQVFFVITYDHDFLI